jgi:membrane-associated phospholipid phosphatase
MLAAVLVCSALPVLAQTAGESQPQGEKNRSALAVTPGTPAIKNKDLYERSGYWHPFRRMTGFVLTDQKRIWTSPFRTGKQDAKYWAIFVTLTGTLIAFDEKIQKAAPNPKPLVTLGTSGSDLGTYYTLIPITAGFYFLGSKAKDERFREAGLLGFEALINATIVDEGIKLVADRQRPLEAAGEGQFFHSNNRTNSSFPSGHSINTFALASVFAHEYHDKWWVKVLAYSYATGVALSRLAANQHFPSDTLAGGAMGWFIGDYVYAKRHNPEIGSKPSISQKILEHVHFGGAAN